MTPSPTDFYNQSLDVVYDYAKLRIRLNSHNKDFNTALHTLLHQNYTEWCIYTMEHRCMQINDMVMFPF